jgi:hypothetical protein
MPLILPEADFISLTPRLISARIDHTSAFGNVRRRGQRMGSCHEVAVKLAPLLPEEAEQWSDLDAEGDACVLTLPNPLGLKVGDGAPKVDGSGQSGTTLNLKGVTPHYEVRRRAWVTVITGGSRYAYRAAARAVADATGDISIPLLTMLRRPHLDDDVVRLAQPQIEGFVEIAEDAWEETGDGYVWLEFIIRERG